MIYPLRLQSIQIAISCHNPGRQAIQCIALFCLIFSVSSLVGFSQIIITDSSQPGYRTVVLGEHYKRNRLHEFFWGKHYRKEWATAVTVPVIDLEKEAGGLQPTEQGGGRQTRTLRLKNPKGKEYVLRSVDKTYRGALPADLANTFIEDLANDQVSTAHPFAAIAIPLLIEAAGVYHTNPKIVFVPYSATLGAFNEVFANTVCLFEERPDDDQSDASNFGNSKEVVSTAKMLEKIREENDHQVDQSAFVRARLFDMFIGDWGRHEDQWRWAKFEIGDQKIYRPIPRDRDQAWTKFDGVLLGLVMGAAGVEHLQSFDDKIKNVETYNFPARNLDRRLTNNLPKQIWLDIATDIQQRLTDALIEKSIRQMPPEILTISGDWIIRNLKQRRDDLMQYAERYYEFISKEVDIPGSEQAEYFEINLSVANKAEIHIYDLDKEGRKKEQAFYSRKFFKSETNEIRLYGLKSNDVYNISGTSKNIKIRIVGGIDRDSVYSPSHLSQGLNYYDNKDNIVVGSIRSKISNDTTINRYEYASFQYDDKGLIYLPSFSNRRGVFWNLGYRLKKQGWRKHPFSSEQHLMVNYSISNNAFGGDYDAAFYELIGKLSFFVHASFDEVLDNHFLGIGNNTNFSGRNADHKMFTQEGNLILDINRQLTSGMNAGIRGRYDMIKVLAHHKDFKNPLLPTSSDIYENKQFAGIEAYINYTSFNNEVVPTRGLRWTITAGQINNLKQPKSFQRYSALFGFYLPITKVISFATRNGVQTVNGEAELYQLPTLGGGTTLRGHLRQRYYARTIAYTNNDLRFIFNVKSYLYSGKVGLIAFADNGRAWQPGEDSNRWHLGYGGGILLAPFNRTSVTVYYGLSNEPGRIHIRLGRFL